MKLLAVFMGILYIGVSLFIFDVLPKDIVIPLLKYGGLFVIGIYVIELFWESFNLNKYADRLIDRIKRRLLQVQQKCEIYRDAKNCRLSNILTVLYRNRNDNKNKTT